MDGDDRLDRMMDALDRGEYETHPDGSITVCGQRIDKYGNPMVKHPGCPNCGAGAGWIDILEAAATENSGRPLDAACSRRCALQLEHAAEVAARRIAEEAA